MAVICRIFIFSPINLISSPFQDVSQLDMLVLAMLGLRYIIFQIGKSPLESRWIDDWNHVGIDIRICTTVKRRTLFVA